MPTAKDVSAKHVTLNLRIKLAERDKTMQTLALWEQKK